MWLASKKKKDNYLVLFVYRWILRRQFLNSSYYSYTGVVLHAAHFGVQEDGTAVPYRSQLQLVMWSLLSFRFVILFLCCVSFITYHVKANVLLVNMKSAAHCLLTMHLLQSSQSFSHQSTYVSFKHKKLNSQFLWSVAYVLITKQLNCIFTGTRQSPCGLFRCESTAELFPQSFCSILFLLFSAVTPRVTI